MKNKIIRAVLILISPIWISLFNREPYVFLIWAVNGYLISIIATTWIVIEGNTLLEQIGNDLIYCLIMQGPAISFELQCLMNWTDKQQNHPLLIFFILLLNIGLIILFDCLIYQANFQNKRQSKG